MKRISTAYCRSCGARLRVADSYMCAACAERTRALVDRAPDVPAEFWQVDQMRDALASWHMGRVIAAYRTHPYHRRPLSQEQVGVWVGLTQAQLSRIEHGPPIKDLDRLSLWARTLRIPTDLLWFKLREQPTDGADGSAGRSADSGSAGKRGVAGEETDPQPWREPPRTLPPVVPDFTGREAARSVIAAALAGGAAGPRWVLVSGQAGLGKTALAVRVAHDVASVFPDGQLFVRLRRPDGAGVPPEVALASLLRALGYRGATVPQDLDERSALFRSAVADRQVLLVFDDVVDETQLRWMLPGSPTCAVLMTSRSRLAGIEGLERPLLEPLSFDESHLVLRSIVGEQRVRAEPDAAHELIELAAGLPLALRIIAARLVSRPQWPLEHMRQLLADERRRLDWLKAGDHEVRASLLTSYAHLTPQQQRVFRMLGLLDAPDFPAWVASALMDDHMGRAEQDLEALADVHLVDVSPGEAHGPRYRLHPLVRLLAAELAAAEEPAEDREAAIRRVISGYLVTADAAAKRSPRRFIFDDLPDSCWQPARNITERAGEDAMRWFAQERQTLSAIIADCSNVCLVPYSWRLLQRLTPYLDRRHDLDTLERLVSHLLPIVRNVVDQRGEAALLRLRCHVLAFRSLLMDVPPLARRIICQRHSLGDIRAEIEGRRILGAALLHLDISADARLELRIALLLARRFGERYNTGWILVTLATTRAVAGEIDIAIHTFRAARHELRAAGSGGAEAARDLGVLLMRSGRLTEAEVILRDAHRELELEADEWRAATVGITMADLYVELGRHDDAEELVRAGHAVVRSFHDTYGEGVALYVMSRLAMARGERERAKEYSDQAAALWKMLPGSSRFDRWRGAHTER